MKKVFFALIIFLQTGLLIAQVPEDALRLSLNRTSGTARSLSLSNAMGALGGDHSSIGINPAG
ncbi:MAG TPA: transporter, partial [Marinilabiliaceae bacterium]|nr:transporter [Marinilabiliaceae bacterium]